MTDGKKVGLKSDDSDCFFFNLKMTLMCDINIPTEASVMQNVGGGTPKLLELGGCLVCVFAFELYVSEL